MANLDLFSSLFKRKSPVPATDAVNAAGGAAYKRSDAQAWRVLKRLFPTRTVLGVPTREVLLGGGNIHCITQQVPRPVGTSQGR